MVKCLRYSHSFNREWDTFIEASNHNLFFFKRKFIEYHGDKFLDFSLVFIENEQIIAVFPANKIQNIAYSHSGLTFGGLIFPRRIRHKKIKEIYNAMKTYFIENGIEQLTYKCVPPIFGASYSADIEYLLHHDGAKISSKDLSSVVMLEKKAYFSKGRRAQIKRALNNNLNVAISEKYFEFHNLLQSNLLLHNAVPAHSAEELKYLVDQFPNNINLHVVEKDGEIIAGILWFIFETFAHSQYICSSELGRKLGAVDLIIASMLDDQSKKKRNFLSFGRSSTGTGEVMNFGLLDQKEGFGAVGICLNTYNLRVHD